MKKLFYIIAFAITATCVHPMILSAGEFYLDCDLTENIDANGEIYQAYELSESDQKHFMYLEIRDQQKITKLNNDIHFLVFSKQISSSQLTKSQFIFETTKRPDGFHRVFDISRVTGELIMRMKGR